MLSLRLLRNTYDRLLLARRLPLRIPPFQKLTHLIVCFPLELYVLIKPFDRLLLLRQLAQKLLVSLLCKVALRPKLMTA